MPKLLGLIAALFVFCLWHSVIGNPHVVETIIGLVLAISAGVWVYIESNKYFRKKSLPVVALDTKEKKDNHQSEDLPPDTAESEKTIDLIGELTKPGMGMYILKISLVAIVGIIIMRAIR